MLADINVNGRLIKAVVAADQAMLAVRVRSEYGQAGLAHRGAASAERRRARRVVFAHAAVPHQASGLCAQGVSVDDLIDFTPELRAEAVKIAAQYRLGPMLHASRREQAGGTARDARATFAGRRDQLAGRGIRSRNAHRVYAYAQDTITPLGLGCVRPTRNFRTWITSWGVPARVPRARVGARRRRRCGRADVCPACSPPRRLRQPRRGAGAAASACKACRS